jgi:hypothetical protein
LKIKRVLDIYVKMKLLDIEEYVKRRTFADEADE